MKNNETVSVIIPVYNVEKYLRKCLDSIISQTYKDIEIICVNDGSKDNSLDILKEYEQKDERIKIIDKPNGGLSSARNSGLDVASGKWCYFVDSDDSIDVRTIETCVKYMKQYDVDCVVHYFVNIPEDESCVSMAQSTEDWLNCRKKETGLYEVPINISAEIPAVAWNKLYKMEIIKKYNCRFPQGLINEDEEFVWTYFIHCKTYYNINDCLYFYLRRNTSIMGQRNKSVKILDILKIHMHIYDIVSKYKNIDEYKAALTQNYIQTAEWLFSFTPVEYQRRFLKYMKSYIKNVNNDKQIKLLYKKLKHQVFVNKIKAIRGAYSHVIKHYKNVLYSNSKRGIKKILNAKIKELSAALNDLQQNTNSKISELSDAMNNQQQEYKSKLEELSAALNDLQQNANSKISELSDAMNNQQKEYSSKIEALQNIQKEIINSVIESKNITDNSYAKLFVTNNNDASLMDELKKLGKFYYLPNKGNLGDVLLAFSTYQFFDAHNFDYEVFDMTNVSSYDKPFNFVYGGGGIWNGLYKPDYQEILDVFQNPLLKKCVILPSSFYDCDDVLEILDERFTVFCREEQSYKYCTSLNKKARFLLASDMAVNADLECFYGEIYNNENVRQLLSCDNKLVNMYNVIFNRYMFVYNNISTGLANIDNRHVGYMLREDRESLDNKRKKSNNNIDLSGLGGGFCTDKSYDVLLSLLFVATINLFDVIVTDRLHIAICAAKLNKQVILLDNSYKKNSSVYNYSLKSFKNVHLTTAENIESLISKLSDTKLKPRNITVPSTFLDVIGLYGSIPNIYGIEKRWWN